VTDEDDGEQGRLTIVRFAVASRRGQSDARTSANDP
jgi:hypothetical protein